MDDSELIKKKLTDADRAAYGRNILKVCGFLGLQEQSIYHSLERSFVSEAHFLSGGMEQADRTAAFFLPDYMDRETAEEEAFAVIIAEPVNAKFSDELSHRDYLGALMNLGIERECIGDITVSGRGTGETAIIVMKNMAELIARELVRVKHTSIDCTVMGLGEFRNSASAAAEKNFEELKVNVASERADAVVAAVYRISRQKAAELVAAERVFINGSVLVSAGKDLKADDVVTVRGSGKFIYCGVNGTSRKGRLYADIKRYA